MNSLFTRHLFFMACYAVATLAASDSTVGALVVTIEGTTEAADLNGFDLGGTNFTYFGLITDTNDIDDTIADIGTFVVEEAFITFESGELFSYGDNSGWFSWGLTSSGDFFAGAMLSVDTTQDPYVYDNGIAFTENDGSYVGFNPDLISEFGPVAGIDRAFAINGSFSASNSMGDSLLITGLADRGTLTVSAVPEPSSALFLLAGISCITLHRRRQT